MHNVNYFAFILGMKRRVIVKGNSAAEFVANEPKDDSFLGVRLLSKDPYIITVAIVEYCTEFTELVMLASLLNQTFTGRHTKMIICQI